MIIDLSKGFTENVITRVDNLVIKTGKNAINERIWYDSYLDKADIPYILGEKDGSIVMNYVERTGEFNINEIIKIVDKYKKYKKLNDILFNQYIKRIRDHLDKNEDITNGGRLINKLITLKIEGTFSHGDLSIQNIIPTNTGLKLIDPLYSPEIFGSYIIDYAKLLLSLKFFNNDINQFNYLKSIISVPDVLVASECVRISTYKRQFSFIAENLINEL